MSKNGTGKAATQPSINIFFRVNLLDKKATARFANAFVKPNASMKERITAYAVRSNTCSPNPDNTERSNPIIAPTNAFTKTSR